MVTTWVLIITLLLPSFGGPVTIQVVTQTKAGCEKFRSAIVKKFSELLIPDTGLGRCMEMTHTLQ